MEVNARPYSAGRDVSHGHAQRDVPSVDMAGV